jgi:hypothetical protein
MHLSFQPNPNRFSTNIPISQAEHLSFDIISPPTSSCGSPSDTTSLHNAPMNNQVTTSTSFTKNQSQSDILHSCDSMFSSYKNFGRSDILNSFDVNISTRLLQLKNSEPEVETSVDESRSSCVPIANSLTTYSSNLWIDNLNGKHKFNDPLPPARNQTSYGKRVLDLEPMDQEFTRDEAKKIAANKKLAELALSDPKRVKR